MRRGIRAGIVALFALAASPGLAQPAGSDWPEAIRDFTTPEQIGATAARFPNSAGMQRRRLGVAVRARDAASAADAVRRLAAMGGIIDAASQSEVGGLIGAEAMAPVTARMTENGRPVGFSRVAFVVPREHRLIEGLVWDSRARRFYVNSVLDRRTLALDAGRASPVAHRTLGSVLGGAYDAVRRRLWLTSAQVGMIPDAPTPFVGLVAFDPARPRDERRIPAPAGATPGDVVVARDGTVYASDGLIGAVYRCRPGCTALETQLPPGTLFSAQGLALSADQRLLYVADRRYGLAALERASGRLLRVSAPEDVMLDGIDALVAVPGGLAATQTAYPPQRIIRLMMSPDGLSVTRLDILERANPEWGEVTLAALADDRLYYVADAQWERYGPGGAAPAEGPARATAIRVLGLSN